MGKTFCFFRSKITIEKASSKGIFQDAFFISRTTKRENLASPWTRLLHRASHQGAQHKLFAVVDESQSSPTHV